MPVKMQDAHTEFERDIGALYPDLTDAQRREAAYFLSGYLDVVQRIFERTQGLTATDEPNSL